MANALDLTATPQRIQRAARAAQLPDDAVARALDIVVRTPDAAAWRRFLSRTLALLGTCLVLAGATCFVAYNWSRIGRFGKFALIESAIVGATVFAWRKLPGLPGQAALFAAAVLVGPLLAVYGQTYQTGADPYGLFLTWSLLILPWTLVARFSALWLLVIVLLDVAALQFGSQVFDDDRDQLWMVLGAAALHWIAVASWEWQARRPTPWLDERWAVRIVAALCFLALLSPAVVLVVDERDAGVPGYVALGGLIAAIVMTFRFYRQVRRDSFMVTTAAVAGMVLVTVLMGRIILDVMDLDELGLLLMAAIVVAEIAVGIKWYRQHAS